ncbi:MAG: chitobiase/beta-hexosaminidase C-terminal domain-containing protein [Clostridia bacterium]|nr:chitobiase/beta-hexosaminidase C-terminal domain-containing protein [Clostridia bacterium]
MKKTGKRLLALLLCLCLTAVLAPSVSAEGGSALQNGKTLLLSEEQIATLRAGGMISTTTAPTVQMEKSSLRKANTLPSSFDLRAKGLVREVKDQGISGPCWAFGNVTALESEMLPLDPTIDLSEKHLAYFSYGSNTTQNAFSYLMGGFTENSPYDWGGFTITPVYSLANWYGPATEENYPYGMFDALPSSAATDAVAHMQQAYMLPVIDKTQSSSQIVAQMQEVTRQAKQLMIDKQSALSAGFYSSGTNDYNENTYAWYNLYDYGTDHGVAVVGWDDNFSKSNFTHASMVPGDGAWLVKNSWGPEFGDNGYFWLSYYDMSLVLEACYGLEETGNYDHLYSYDEFLYPGAMMFDDSKSATMANVFTMQRAERLEAVSFYTSDQNTRYTINLYKNPTSSRNPRTGTLIGTLSGTESYWGYHTVNLSSPVQLKAGDRVSVVVTLNNPNEGYVAYVEMSQTDNPYSLTLSSSGQSFLYTDDYGWEDLYNQSIDMYDGSYLKYGNFPIKLFTSDSQHVLFSETANEASHTLTLTKIGSGTIYYTTDGSNPQTAGVAYSSPIAVTADMTVKACVGRSGTVREWQASVIQPTLMSLLTIDGENYEYLPVNESMQIETDSGMVTLSPIANGAITVGGLPVTGGQIAMLAVPSKGVNTVPITVTRGDATVTYTLRLSKPNAGEMGDVDGDGHVTSTDARVLVRWVVYPDGVPLEDWQLALCDLDGDGKVDTTDCRKLLKLIIET